MGVPISGNQGGRVEFDPVGVGPLVEIPDVLSWSLEQTSDNQPFVSSQTAGQTKRVTGNKDWTATVEFLLDDGDEIALTEGEKGAITLHTSTLAGSGGNFSGEAIIDSISVNVSPTDGAIVSATIVFSADGALVFTTI